jgi:hypothetical protein
MNVTAMIIAAVSDSMASSPPRGGWPYDGATRPVSAYLPAETYRTVKERPMRRILALAAALVVFGACGNADAAPDGTAQAAAGAQQLPPVLVYKTTTCLCCAGWVEHMRQAGFAVDVRDLPGNLELMQVKAEAGVPADMASCHTSLIGDYVVEGHVPADQVKRLLSEHPAHAGIAAPGMPAGSPGMDVPNSPPYEIVAWNRDGTRLRYAEIRPR